MLLRTLVLIDDFKKDYWAKIDIDIVIALCLVPSVTHFISMKKVLN